MGYYNLPPTKYATDLNDLEKLLRTLSLEGAMEALDLLETLCRNIVQHSAEDKFRKVRTTNAKLAPLFSENATADIMFEMGWELDPTGEYMVLPRSIQLDFPKHINKILEAKSHFAKQREQAKKSAKLGDDPNKATVLKQLEIDRRERAAAAGQVAPPAPAPNGYQSAQAPAAAPAAAPAQEARVATMSEEEQLRLAMQMSMQESAPAPGNAPGAGRSSPPEAPAVPAVPQHPSGKPKQGAAPHSAFDFERREKPEEKRKEAELSLQDLRALQKEKFKDFQADPNAKNGEAYKQAPSVAPGGQDAGWFDWMWGGSSSSSSGGGGGGGRPGGSGGGQKKNMKTIADLPKPVRRGG